MDDFTEEKDSEGAVTWTKKVELEDGGYVMTKVEKVSNGYLKSIDKSMKEDNEWKHESTKSIHEDNPMEEKSIVDKLAAYLKG
jgi:hypothetical protein